MPVTQADLAMLTKALGPVIREFAAKENAALRAENAALVARVTALEGQKVLVPRDGLNGKDGQSVTMADVAPFLTAEVHKFVSALPPAKDGDKGDKGDPGTDGKDAPEADLAAIAARVLALMPLPEKGDPGRDGDKGDPGIDGKGTDGKSVTVDDVMPLIVREIEQRVAAVPIPKDGTGFTSALINREGHLVLTLSDGTTQNVGPVVGKDGANGLDGLGFDDYDVRLDETRGVLLSLRQGERVKEFVMPSTFYTGDWEPGKEYPPGASFAFDGHTWVVRQKNSAKPEQGSPLWWISSRRGKQGREGKQGKDGKDGQNHTSIDPATGRTW